MKKFVAFAIAINVMMSAVSLTSLAAEKTEKADLPESVYQQLVEQVNIDINEDGIITEEEYCNATSITLDLEGVDSIDFLDRLVSPRYLYLLNGNISDFSSLAKFNSLETLQLSDMPQVTDISFVKGMNLLKFYIVGLEQITDEQKIEVMKFHDADTSVGFSALIGATPKGMFEYDKLLLEISDTSVAGFDTSKDNPVMTSFASIYGRSAGSTEYSLKLKGNEIYKGKINVKEISVTTLPDEVGQTMPKISDTYFYSEADKVVLKDGKLYK